MENKSRIGLLDSFRFIAIIMVVFFHYYHRWNIDNSTRGLFDFSFNTSVFKYGYLGVEFFFIISGFVIYYTLNKTAHIFEFLKKRFFRLFPAMLLCSLITFLVFFFFDNESVFIQSSSFKNFLCSITFLSPMLLNALDVEVQYVDGSYWSLWVEIQFYIIAAILFYTNRKRFLRNFLMFSFIVFGLNLLLSSKKGVLFFNYFLDYQSINSLKKVFTIFDFSQYALWFLLGVLFYKLMESKRNTKLIFTIVFVSFIQLYLLKHNIVRCISFSFIGLFFIMIFKPKFLSFLEKKWITTIGLISYSLYLIHQNIGVYLLSIFYDSVNSCFFTVIPILLILFFILFAYTSFYYFEKPINKFLNRKI